MSKLTIISATIGPYKITITSRYLTNTAIREKLAPVKLNRYKDDILFYMFYTNVGDVLQMAAAAELYNRDWRWKKSFSEMFSQSWRCCRYHKEERVWITRAPGMAPSEKTTSYERGTYYFFDVNSWRKVMVSLIHFCIIPSIAGAQRIPLGLRQTWGTTISAIIPASRAITRSCGRWRSASQSPWTTEWKSGAHGGAGSGRSWRLASCGTTQLRTIVKGEVCEEGELRTILTIPLDRWLVVIQPIIDHQLPLGWTMMISK